MKKTRTWAGAVLVVMLAGLALTGCGDEDTPDPSENIAAAWTDIQSGFVTTLNNNGTYTVSTGTGLLIQTGTWSTMGNQITFFPTGDAPATMTYSLSPDGNTMTIVDEGETTVLTR